MIQNSLKAIASNLRYAQDCIQAGSSDFGLAYLHDALSQARYTLPSNVPKYRCLRAYIVQAIGALEHANT